MGCRGSDGCFQDQLGRCVVMIGLPYPSLASVELKEKMAYLRSKNAYGGKDAGKEYYQNICMKAVNQSIGRAIRHRHDYAGLALRHLIPIPMMVCSSSSCGSSVRTKCDFWQAATMDCIKTEKRFIDT